MAKEWLVDLVARVPQGTVSRAWGWVATRRRPKLAVSVLKHAFVRATGIDMRESEEPIESFASLQQLFVRHLRRGARRIDADPHSVVSPCDGTLGQCGRIQGDTLVQAKGRHYTLARLLGSEEAAAPFRDGSFATIYLAPHNYHRIHAPVAGRVGEATLIPGRLFPVFAEAVANVDELFARNERLITHIDSDDAGRVAVVKVGATLVGHITVTYDPHLYSNVRGQLRRTVRYDPPKAVTKGADLGAFELGSTVVLLFQRNRVRLDNLEPGQVVRMGEAMGRVRASAPSTRVPRPKSATAKAKARSKASARRSPT